jgi:hypothetical protein
MPSSGAMMLELVESRPNWMGALTVALTRPPGTPERRQGQDPWRPETTGRPRRIADDLAWLRDAVDEPQEHDLEEIRDSAAVSAWRAGPDAAPRLRRLEDRRVLDAAGFLVHDLG